MCLGKLKAATGLFTILNAKLWEVLSIIFKSETYRELVRELVELK
ncbi:hypothetical protein HMPREF0497_0434 [Lentilactobacillus buchneri ATCC 11577]|nr:hypothetical protein HMPREF0497_0434 [Lentilactobacillus buchneri ATCC 11577]